MDELIKVIFEPFNVKHCKVTADYQSGEQQIVYLDNNSARQLMKLALTHGTMSI